MATSSISPGTEVRSSIHGTTNITVKILDLEDGDKIVKELLADPELLPRIRAIDIVDTEAEAEDAEDAEETQNTSAQPLASRDGGSDIDAASTKSSGSANTKAPGRLFDKDYVDKRMTKLCAPIFNLLEGIENSGGSLTTFSWTQVDGWYDSYGTRPKEFWSALYRHARTLQSLTLGFYTHELHKVLPATISFPSLVYLEIDATTAHGDEGDAVEALLKNAPNLEKLKFAYPVCDLETCQIRNITWDYDFPHLTRLEVSGYDFAPQAFQIFLSRCDNLEYLKDEIDHDGDVEHGSLKKLSPTSLRNIKALYMPIDRSQRFLEGWFDPAASRGIQHLVLHGSGFDDISSIANGKETLRCLEFEVGITNWRPREPDSDDEQIPKEDGEEKELPGLPKEIKKLLPQLSGLRELGFGLESGDIIRSNGNGEWGHPPPMSENELKIVLSVLTPQTKIKVLRLWDSKAVNLSQGLLDDFPEIPKSLKYLSWEGEEKTLYRLERRDGSVRAVPCEPLRVVNDVGDWTDRRDLAALWNED